jgi:tetratricopeptide (TPR) repeat protein
LARGLEHHQAGRLKEAKLIYEQILGLDARHPDALHLLGVVALQRQDPDRAVGLIERAIQVHPGNPGYHANLAQAWLATQRVVEALAAFRSAARLDPRNPQYAVGAASCLAMQGHLSEAEEQLRKVTRDDPGYALAWLNLGNAVREQGRQQEALDLLVHAVELEPALADAHSSVGTVLHALARFEEAEIAYRRCLALQPESEAGYRNLASVLMDCGRFADAAIACQQGLARAPGSAELHMMLGSAFVHQGRLTAALGAFRSAGNLAPDNPRALWAYGFALRGTGAAAQGMEQCERVLEQHPDSPEFRHAISGAYLSLGNLRAGWMEYEWRPARQTFLAENPGIRLAAELPASLPGKKICLLREQGPGDELFFLRFAAELKSRGAEITYLAHAKLASLLGRVPALDRVITDDVPLPTADLAVLVGDLPRLLGRLDSSPYHAPSPSLSAPRAATTSEDRYQELLIESSSRRRGPSNVPDILDSRLRENDETALDQCFLQRLPRVFYPELPPPLALTVLPSRLQDMKRRLAGLGPPPYLGLTWRAGVAPRQQRSTVWVLHKSIPLDQLGAALREVGGTLLALQRGPENGEIGRLASITGKPVHDLTALNEELEGMLALLALVDEYIGVSNTNMHLRAGAGRSARVLVPCPPEWRWMAAGDESPWFPGFRIYRQGIDGEWSNAVERLTSDLRRARPGSG